MSTTKSGFSVKLNHLNKKKAKCFQRNYSPFPGGGGGANILIYAGSNTSLSQPNSSDLSSQLTTPLHRSSSGMLALN